MRLCNVLNFGLLLFSSFILVAHLAFDEKTTDMSYLVINALVGWSGFLGIILSVAVACLLRSRVMIALSIVSFSLFLPYLLLVDKFPF